MFSMKMMFMTRVGFLIPAIMALTILYSCTGNQDRLDDYYKAEKAFASGRLNEAAQSYEIFLEKVRDSPYREKAWERLLVINLDIRGDIEQGLNILKTMSIEYENDAEMMWSIYMRIGRLFALQKEYESGIEAKKRAIDITDDKDRLIDAYLGLADIYYMKRDYSQALNALKASTDMDFDLSMDQRSRVDYQLGKVFYQLSDREQAIQYLENVFHSEADENLRSKSGILLYDVYLYENKHEQAERLIKELEKIYPNPKVIRMRRDDIRSAEQ